MLWNAPLPEDGNSTRQNSDTGVLRARPKFEALAINALGDGLTNSSVAVSDGEIFIRTYKHLWRIGAPK